MNKEYKILSLENLVMIFMAAVLFGLWQWSFSAAFCFLFMATVSLRVFAKASVAIAATLDKIARK